jgi:3-methyladenine DNA glycosylase AlkD
VTATEVLAELETLGTESTKRTLMRHGAREPFFGVRVGDLKTLVKKIKVDHALALALYDTGNSDAMYLAALIADPMAFTKPQLRKWVKGAYWYMLSGFTVPWSASESKFGRELALEWIDGDGEQVQNAGWCTYASLVAIKPDAELDLKEIEALMAREEGDRQRPEPNAVRDEQFRHLGGLLRRATEHKGKGRGEGAGRSGSGHGRDQLHGAGGAGLHRKGGAHGPRGEEAQARRVLNARRARCRWCARPLC